MRHINFLLELRQQVVPSLDFSVLAVTALRSKNPEGNLSCL